MAGYFSIINIQLYFLLILWFFKKKFEPAFAFFDVIISVQLKCIFDFRVIIFVIYLFELIHSSKVYIFVLIKIITIILVNILYKYKYIYASKFEVKSSCVHKVYCMCCAFLFSISMIILGIFN